MDKKLSKPQVRALTLIASGLTLRYYTNGGEWANITGNGRWNGIDPRTVHILVSAGMIELVDKPEDQCKIGMLTEAGKNIAMKEGN